MLRAILRNLRRRWRHLRCKHSLLFVIISYDGDIDSIWGRHKGRLLACPDCGETLWEWEPSQKTADPLHAPPLAEALALTRARHGLSTVDDSNGVLGR